MKTKRVKTSVLSSDNQKPNAWIVVNNRKDKFLSTDRGRKSVKNGNKIYLNDGDEFEIELFNPLKISVLANIKVNNISVSENGLVLRPGERFYLDCFIDSLKKFVFKTYEIKNTLESKMAISNNGYVEVFFYKENITELKNWQNVIINETIYVNKYITYPTHSINTLPSYILTTNSPYQQSNVTYTIANSNDDIFRSNINGSNISSSYSVNTLPSYISMIESGRVEKGETSSQQFTEVDIDFEKYYISHISYQILPNSRKPIETKELVKETKNKINYCSQCGNKI